MLQSSLYLLETNNNEVSRNVHLKNRFKNGKFTFRCYQSWLILGPGLLMMISLTQGKQDVINSKIHYLSLNSEETNGPISRSNPNIYQTRLKLNSGMKESSKINIDVKFINNGRPYRVNSKRSKLLRNLKRRKGDLLRQSSGSNHQLTIRTIKHLQNKTAQSEKAEHSSHESGNSDEDSLGDKRENVKILLSNEMGKLESASSQGIFRQISRLFIMVY